MEIFEIGPAEGFAGSWVMNSAGRMVDLERGVRQTSWKPPDAWWKTTEGRKQFPIPDVDLTQSLLLVRPELMDGLPLKRGVDFEELEVIRRDFPHRVLSILNAPGAFDAEASDCMTVGTLIIAVTRYVFDEASLAGRTSFLAEGLVAHAFVTRRVVDYFAQRQARGIAYRRVWPSREGVWSQ